MDKSKEKLESLQIVRAIAMLLVLFAHIDIFSNAVLKSGFLFGLFRLGGGAGVDLFFVLSGFVITFIHQKDIGKKSQSISYLIKRFTRIYPTYWIANLIIIPLHFLLPQFGSGDETQIGKIVSSVLLFPDKHAPIVHAGWTLSNEVYFYILFGLLIVIGFKKFLPILLFILIGTFIQSFFFLQGNFVGNNVFPNPWVKLAFSYYNIEFLLGCLSAYLVSKNKINARKTLLIYGITFFLFMMLFERFRGDINSLRVYFYGIPSFLIITALSSYEKTGLMHMPNKLFPKLLIFLGNASFSIYVTHQVLVSATGRLLQALGFINIFGMFITLTVITLVTLLVGSIFHLKVEKPLWHYSRKKLLSLYSKS